MSHVARVLEVYREPRPDPDATYGWAYRSRASLDQTASVAPLAMPPARIAVSQQLP